MTKSERFSPVLKVAETKKREAARVAMQTRQKLREYEHKLDELRSFRDEYALHVHTGNQSINAMQLQEQQKFVQQLNEGINILKTKIEGQKQNNDMDTQAWQEAYKYSSTIDKLISKIRRIELGVSETRESNELDDRTQYRSTRKRDPG